MKQWLYKVQQLAAITEAEARALGVVFLLLTLGLGARYGAQRWGVPDPVEPLYITQQTNAAAPDLMGEADSTRVADPMASAGTETKDVAQHKPKTPRPPGPVKLNAATAAELQRLPGIGPAMAKRIIDYRTQYGPFRSVTDLLSVKGIGPKTLEKLTPLVTVGE